MNECEATDLLQRLAGGVREVPPPVGDLVAGGRTMRRRRRLRNAVGVAAVMGVALVGGAVALQPDDRAGRDAVPSGPDQQSPERPTAAPGTRLVGLGRVAVEVPKNWVVAEDGCARDTGVVWRYPDTDKEARQLASCPPFPADEPWTSMAVGDATSPTGSNSIQASWSQQVEINGLSVTQSSFHHGPPEFCGPIPEEVKALRECDLLFWTPAEDTYFHIIARDPAGRQTILAIRDSIQILPEGYASVPFIQVGTSDADAAKVLQEAGLDAEPPEVDWPHYVIATEPSAGSVVPVGSTVQLIPGDG